MDFGAYPCTELGLSPGKEKGFVVRMDCLQQGGSEKDVFRQSRAYTRAKEYH